MSRRHERRRRQRLTATEVDLDVAVQRAVLVGAVFDGESAESAELSLDELERLVDTAGARAVASELQRRPTADPATFVGSGKVAEIDALLRALNADVVVVDAELTPAQQRNLEAALRVDVVDRVALILDIFAMHATSQVGMLQVELAQLRYRLPRLRGRGASMSQQGGGSASGSARLATRGPGETKLETDRRRILRRITKLERDLAHLTRTRAVQRKARLRSGVRRVALVGYTNAGKSTLLNQLTSSEVLVEDRLFSTLDPTARRLVLPGGTPIVVSDTVGFLQRLPHELVEAFRSTLEETAEVDLVVHVADASASDVAGQNGAVREVLADIGAGATPELVVWNKVDRADRLVVKHLVADHPGSIAVSALSGEGLEELLVALESRLRTRHPVTELRVPYERGDVVARVHALGDVVEEHHDAHGTTLVARLPDGLVRQLAEFRSDAPARRL